MSSAATTERRRQSVAAISDSKQGQRQQPATAPGTRTETAPGRRERGDPRGAGFDNVPQSPPGTATRCAHCHTGLPREARCGPLLRQRRRPPARHRRGRSPSHSPPKRPRRWGDAGPPKADRKAGAVRTGNSDSGRDSVTDSGRGSGRVPRSGTSPTTARMAVATQSRTAPV